MSVIIKGMEMPKSCDDCNFESLMCCFLLEKRLAIETFKKGERDKDCPLVEAQEWISVTERLPEESGCYLIADSGHVSEAYYGKGWAGDYWTDPVEMYMTFHPTHWLPIPQPPESDDSLSCGIRRNVQQKSTVDNGACFNGEPSEKVQDE